MLSHHHQQHKDNNSKGILLAADIIRMGNNRDSETLEGLEVSADLTNKINKGIHLDRFMNSKLGRGRERKK